MNTTWKCLVFLLIVLLGLGGCNGSDGARGPQGPPGQDGQDGLDGQAGQPGQDGQDGQDGKDASQAFSLAVEQPETLVLKVTEITAGSRPTIRFTLTDAAGRAALDLGSAVSSNRLSWIRFSVAKLVPGTNHDPDVWNDYVNGERVPANLTDNRDGSYRYLLAKDLGAYDAAIPFQSDLTHRLAIQSSGGDWAPLNVIVDYVPSQLPGPGFVFPNTRDIVTTAACNECHGELTLHGSRYDTRYCVVCHNPTLGEGDFPVMVHAIHAAGMREDGYELGGHDYSHVGYPQDLRNCDKCHQGTQGAQWKTRPSMAACGSCHDNVDFANGVNHITQVNNSVCYLCHSDTAIAGYHVTESSTAHNPDLPAGAAHIQYEIASVTVNASRQAVVKFRILANGAPLTFNTYAAGASLLDAFTGSPSFLLPYALPQDGVESPADYNNLGRSAAQPASVSITNVWNGSAGALTGPDGSGYYTATITSEPYPVGATLRAVALQGYFTQKSPSLARHAVSVIRGVTGDVQRRQVVDDAKCAACHEQLELHGGNRVATTGVCAACHVPNLTSSGRAADLSAYVPGSNSATDATIDALGSDPLAWPEDSNNLKDLVHGIHGAAAREGAYRFVRDRGNSGRYYYDWSHVTYPGELADCRTCHLDGTYRPSSVPAGALRTNGRTTTGNPAETRLDVAGARDSVPNPTDWVSTPIASACAYCHDGAAAAAHMEQNGGAIRRPRQDVPSDRLYEACDVCHGPGKMADIEIAHQGD